MPQYLARYAETEVSLFKGSTEAFSTASGSGYDHVLCIPAFAEPVNFLQPLLAAVKQASILVILVVNAHIDAPAGQIRQTRDIASHLKQQYPAKAKFAENIHLLAFNDSIDVLLVERCNPDFYLLDKDGVGLARKIACDIACQLITMGRIRTAWIHSTDADAVLPADYFQASSSLDNKLHSAGIYPFTHTSHADQQIALAQKLYDFSLDYYVAGLAWAGSPWAYHTIGSTLLINAEHYAMVRGFPKRQAGEDFYLLNKLAKTGRIKNLKTTPLELASRLSDRVPFGTGPALSKIMAMANPLEQYHYYHPQCFLYLKCWLAMASTLPAGKAISLSSAHIDAFKHESEEYREVDSQVLLACLQALGLDKILAHAFSHSKTNAVLQRHLQNWLDGFVSLKFIHWLRDTHFPSLPLSVLVAQTQFPFLKSLTVPENGFQLENSNQG